MNRDRNNFLPPIFLEKIFAEVSQRFQSTLKFEHLRGLDNFPSDYDYDYDYDYGGTDQKVNGTRSNLMMMIMMMIMMIMMMIMMR